MLYVSPLFATCWLHRLVYSPSYGYSSTSNPTNADYSTPLVSGMEWSFELQTPQKHDPNRGGRGTTILANKDNVENITSSVVWTARRRDNESPISAFCGTI